MSVAAKQDFLDRLKASISCLPLQDQADILNDYEEHFRIGLENGKTEAEIAGSLGSPEELGASFVEENAQPVPAQEEIFSHSQTAPAPDSPQAAGPQSSPAPWQGQAEAAPQAHQQSQAEPEAPGFGSSQGAQHERTHHQSYSPSRHGPMSDLRTPGKRTPLSRLRRRGSHTPPSAPRTSIRRNRRSSLLILPMRETILSLLMNRLAPRAAALYGPARWWP